MAPSFFNSEIVSQWHKTSKIRFGYFEYDGTFEPSKPIVEALRLARKKLLAAGHEIIDFDGEIFFNILKVYAGICLNGKKIDLEGEKLIPEYGMSYIMDFIPEGLRKYVSKVLEKLGQKRAAWSIQILRFKSL